MLYARTAARAVPTVHKTNAQPVGGIRNDPDKVEFRQKQRREQGLAYRLGCASAYFRMQRSPPETRTRALHVHKIRFVPCEILRLCLRMTGLYEPVGAIHESPAWGLTFAQVQKGIRENLCRLKILKRSCL